MPIENGFWFLSVPFEQWVPILSHTLCLCIDKLEEIVNMIAKEKDWMGRKLYTTVYYGSTKPMSLFSKAYNEK